MCRFLTAVVAIVMFLVSTVAGIFSLFNMDWYTGEAYGTPINIGVQTACTSLDEVSIGSLDLLFCRDFKWGNLSSASEQAMAIMLIISFSFGGLAIIAQLITIICTCTCLGRWTPSIGTFGLLQNLLLIATSLTMAGYYDWRSPTNTHIGAGFIVVLIGIGCSFLGICFSVPNIHRKPDPHKIP